MSNTVDSIYIIRTINHKDREYSSGCQGSEGKKEWAVIA